MRAFPGIGRESLRRKLAAIKSFCRWLEREELIEPGLLEMIKGQRRLEQLPDVPSEADLVQLLDGPIPTACPQRDRVILELLYGCGLRASEVVGIDLMDFQGKDVLLVRGKGKKERLVPIGVYAQRAIEKWLPLRIELMRGWNMGHARLSTAQIYTRVSKRRMLDVYRTSCCEAVLLLCALTVWFVLVGNICGEKGRPRRSGGGAALFSYPSCAEYTSKPNNDREATLRD